MGVQTYSHHCTLTLKDTEDWRNDAENLAPPSHQEALVSVRDLFQKHYKYFTPNFWMVFYMDRSIWILFQFWENLQNSLLLALPVMS